MINIDLQTLAEDEQLEYIEEENTKARSMINDLTEAIRMTIDKIKSVSKPEPRVKFTQMNIDVEGIHIDSFYLL